MPTPSSSPTPSRGWCAGSPIPRIGAVAGNAKVGNRINLITVWQALEYITAQNLERRALAALGAITVVPGAVGAWRREALEQLGGFPGDTLAEDQDLTIAIQKAGYRTLFDSEAIAWTEAPDTARGLARQRFRWAYGTLQCLWKHRDATFRPRYGALGMVALPQVWLFQILFSVVSPLVDLLLVWQIVATGLDYLQHRGQFDSTNLMRMLIFYAAFMAVDLAAARARLRDGEEGEMEPALVAGAAALRLSPADVLRRRAFGLDRHPRSVGGLGQAGPQGDGERAGFHGTLKA